MSVPEPSPRRRRIAKGLTVAILVAAALAALPFAALRSAGVRSAILARAAAALRDATGVELGAGDFTLDLGRRRVEIERVSLSAPGAADRPFLTAARVAAVIEVRTLLRPPLRIVSLEIERPVLDLRAPLPSAPATERERGPLPVEIAHFVIGAGAVLAPDAGADEAAALERLGELRLDGLEATGSLDADQLVVALERGRVTVAGRPPARGLVADASATASGPPGGPWEVRELRLEGEGVELAATLTLGLADDQPLRIAGTVALEPGRLLPEAGPGRLEATIADLDLRAMTGAVRARAEGAPAETLAAIVGEETLVRLSAGGTVLEGEVDLRLEGPRAITGTAQLRWREGGGDAATLLVVDAGTVDGGLPTIDLTARLLPAWRGRLTVDARLRLPSWERPAEAEILRSEAAVESDDLGRTLHRLQTRFPRLLPPLPQGLPLAGPLSLRARATGPIGDPTLRLEGRFRPQPDAVLSLAASGRPLGPAPARPQLAGRLGIEHLDLGAVAALAGALAGGIASGTVDAELRGDSVHFSADLDASELVLAEGRVVDRLHLELDGTPRAITVERLTATAGEIELEARGAVTLDPGAQRPLLAATLDGTIERPIEGVRTVEAWLALADGRLEIDVPAAATDYGTLRGHASVPLAALAAVPALAEAVAALPTRTAEGPMRVEATTPALDGAGLLRRLGVEAPDLLAGAVALELELDPSHPLAGTGVVRMRDLAVADGDARLDAVDPVVLRLAGGRLELQPATLAVAGERARLAGGLELDPAWRPGDPLDRVATALRLEADTDSLDAAALLRALGVEPPFERLDLAGLELRLDADPRDLARVTGALTLRALDLGLPDEHGARTLEPLTLRLADHRVTLEPAGTSTREARIELDGQPLAVTLDARLDPEWSSQRAVTELVSSLEASLRGQVAADVLNPYLAGAAGTGTLALDASVSGTLDRLSGHVHLAPGEEGAEILLRSPYYTRLRDPRLELDLDSGRIEIRTASAELNQGAIELTGGGDLGTGTLDLAATLDGVRYRLDYGVMAEAGGGLRLTRAEDGAIRLEGRIVVERGVLRRDLDPDREILRFLFAPEPIAAPGALDDLELDLEIATVDGLRIRNNLADLRATWAPLTVTGTLAEPRIEGTVDLDPGGYLFAYGQTVRIDSGALELRGDGSPPDLELETTTSFEDPKVASAARSGGFFDFARDSGPGARSARDLGGAVGEGLVGYFGDRLAGRLSEGLGGLDVSLRPVLVFGLDNPGTELTLSRDLSPQVTAAVSVSLREEGRQTYLTEIHDLSSLPSFLGQVFTLAERGDAGASEGVVIQQRVRFGGGGRGRRPEGPRLHRLRVDAPDGVLSRRAARRALGYERGRPLPRGATFEAEVELQDLLARRGYPGAQVEAELVPIGDARRSRTPETADADRRAGGELVELAIAVVPGPQVAFSFAGTALHRSQQRAIASIYRPDFYQPVSLDEMRDQAVRELRAEGYLDPEVTIAVELTPERGAAAAAGDVTPRSDPSAASPPGASSAERRVTITAIGGERVPLSAPRFPGIDDDAARAVASRFASAVLRAELLAGEETADRRLTTALAAEGYPGAVIAGRGLDPPVPGAGPSRAPRVEIVPAGGRQRIAAVRIAGLDGDDGAGLGPLPVAAGDPVRSAAIARGAVAIEEALRTRGHARARVRARLDPATGAERDRELVYQVERSGLFRVGEVTVAGLDHTRPAWAEAVADLEPDTPLAPGEVRAARRRLYQTGLFDSVLPQIDYSSPGAVGVELSVREKQRFELAYGALWQSDEGTSAVVDAVDHNVFGRGITLGARARYRGDDRSGRLYGRLPRVLGTRAAIEAFAEYREERDDDPLVNLGIDTFELDLRASLPLKPTLSGSVYGRYRDIVIFELVPDPIFPLPDQTFRWPVLGLQLVWDVRDDPVAATRGTFASLDLSGADESLGSDFSYARLFSRAAHYLPFGSFRGRPLLWAQSGRLGLARSFRNQSLLGFELLFAGGEYSIRGYDEDSIGPGIFDDVSEQALLVVNEELRVPLYGDLLTGVVFFDAGQVWDDFGDLGSDFLTSGGLGLRARTPVGILRLDLAYPFDRRPGDDRVTVYFGLGQVF